jgi:hypothetical protein
MRSKAKKRKGKFEHFLGQIHLRHGEKRSREKRNSRIFCCIHTHADQVPTLENLKGTVHNIIVCAIILFVSYCCTQNWYFSFGNDIKKRFEKLAFLDKTEYQPNTNECWTEWKKSNIKATANIGRM